MKRALLPILIAFCTLSVFSQTYKPFITPGKQFSVLFIDPMNTNYSHFAHYFFLGDTIINGKAYKPLYKKGYIAYGGNPITPFDELHSFLREDISQQKIYEVYLDSALGNMEYLKWDFSAAIGDTVYNSINFSGAPYVIDSIGKLEINNGDSVRQFFSTSNFGAFPLYTEMVFDGVFGFNFGPHEVCTYQDGQTILYSRGNICDPNDYISIEENTSQFTFYPNPVSESLTIHLEKKAEIEVYSSNGQLVLETTLNKGENHLDLSNQAAGVYYFLVHFDNKLSFRKIIKK